MSKLDAIEFDGRTLIADGSDSRVFQLPDGRVLKEYGLGFVPLPYDSAVLYQAVTGILAVKLNGTEVRVGDYGTMRVLVAPIEDVFVHDGKSYTISPSAHGVNGSDIEGQFGRSLVWLNIFANAVTGFQFSGIDIIPWNVSLDPDSGLLVVTDVCADVWKLCRR